MERRPPEMALFPEIVSKGWKFSGGVFQPLETGSAPVLPIVEAWEAYLQSPDRPDTGENTLRDYAELKEILEGATGDLQTLLFIGTFTGLRLGDCCTLKWGEVDLDRGLIEGINTQNLEQRKKELLR